MLLPPGGNHEFGPLTRKNLHRCQTNFPAASVHIPRKTLPVITCYWINVMLRLPDNQQSFWRVIF